MDKILDKSDEQTNDDLFDDDEDDFKFKSNNRLMSKVIAVVNKELGTDNQNDQLKETLDENLSINDKKKIKNRSRSNSKTKSKRKHKKSKHNHKKRSKYSRSTSIGSNRHKKYRKNRSRSRTRSRTRTRTKTRSHSRRRSNSRRDSFDSKRNHTKKYSRSRTRSPYYKRYDNYYRKYSRSPSASYHDYSRDNYHSSRYNDYERYPTNYTESYQSNHYHNQNTYYKEQDTNRNYSRSKSPSYNCNQYRVIKTPPLPSEEDINNQNKIIEKVTEYQEQPIQNTELKNQINNFDYIQPIDENKPILPHVSKHYSSYNLNQRYYPSQRNENYHNFTYLPKKNNLILIEPKDDVKQSPKNQCQEITSTNSVSNQNLAQQVLSSDKNDNLNPKPLFSNPYLNKKSLHDREEFFNKYHHKDGILMIETKEMHKNFEAVYNQITHTPEIENEKSTHIYKHDILKNENETHKAQTLKKEDDLMELKNKFRMQLKEHLFDKNENKIDDKENNAVELNKSANTSISELNKSEDDSLHRDNDKKKRHKHHHHHHHRHHNHRHHKKSRKETKKRSRSKSDDDNDDDDDLDEYEDIDDDNDDVLSNSIRRSDRIKVIETKKQHHKKLEIAEKLKKHSDLDKPEENENQLNDLIDKPIKVKDRWRRFSEKELTQEELSPTKLLNLTHQPQNSNSPQNNINSPKGFKKMLLTKAVSENQCETEEFVWPSDYEKIDENIYVCKRTNNKKSKESKTMICDCTTSEQERQMGIQACGTDCLNRMLLIECGKRCQCGEYCTNRNFKTKNNSKIIPFKTDQKGWGLKSLNDLKSGSFLIEYVGEIIDLKEFKKRCEKYSEQNNQHFYFMSLQNDLFIDATKKGNISRFFNHSCDPNCETQKWTVNGELRIGFFTRRPVQANEELTFDYQFQTVGKKQQKCYCGSEKCRGYLGASSNSQSNQLNYIWEDETTSEEESITEESESEVENENLNEKVKKNKKKINNKDFDLNRQISSINSLSNKENVLKLCQLMFRTENLEMRLDILDLLLNTKSDMSLKLFMDYHGLKLLWGWMIDIDSLNETLVHLECKFKILQVLSNLSIKNRTVLEECKLLTIVKRWSEIELKANYEFLDSLNENDDLKQWLEMLVDKLIDKSIEESNKKLDENHKNFVDLFDEIRLKSKNLYEEWSNLKQAFKIPKKQQIEERKEHERELNHQSINEQQHTYTSDTLNQSPFTNNTTQNRSFNYKDYKDRGFKIRNRFSYQNYDNNYYFKRNRSFNQEQFNNSQPNLTKEQRRQLFEQKVREEEEKAAALKAEEEARAKEEEELKLKEQHNQQEFKWMYDSQTNQWVQCYVTVNPQITVQPVQPVQMASIYPPLIQSNLYNPYSIPPPPIIQPQQYSFPTIVPPPPPINTDSSLQQHLNKISLSETHLNDLKQVIDHFKPPQSSQLLDKKETSTKNTTTSSSSSKSNHKSLAAIAAKLPPNWKCKRNEKGHVYYYNIKTKKTQWNFPKVFKSSTYNLSTSSKFKSIDKHKVKMTQSEKETKQEEEEMIKKDDKEKSDKISPAITSTTQNEQDKKDDLKLEQVEATTSSASGSVTNSTSSEIFKIYRDQFREKLSRLIIKILQPYMKKDCKYGYIQNTDDFKHLARKFTHTIMEKEISRATKLEELDLDKRIKLKTQEYIKKYMQKFNGPYLRNMDTN